MKPPLRPSQPSAQQAAIADARRMAAQNFSSANITRTLTQKYHLSPAAVQALLAQISPHAP